jgi:hypothetical protein
MKYSGEFMQNLTTNESYTLKNTNDFPRPLRTFHQGIIVALCTSVLAGCQSIDQPPKLLDDGIRAAWVVVGYGNNTARVMKSWSTATFYQCRFAPQQQRAPRGEKSHHLSSFRPLSR